VLSSGGAPRAPGRRRRYDGIQRGVASSFVWSTAWIASMRRGGGRLELRRAAVSFGRRCSSQSTADWMRETDQGGALCHGEGGRGEGGS
jgi:hypothetical protein